MQFCSIDKNFLPVILPIQFYLFLPVFTGKNSQPYSTQLRSYFPVDSCAPPEGKDKPNWQTGKRRDAGNAVTVRVPPIK